MVESVAGELAPVLGPMSIDHLMRGDIMEVLYRDCTVNAPEL